MGDTPAKKKSPSYLNGLNPLGLIDGVMGGQATDWEPPMAEDLELLFPGYHDFKFIDRGGMGAVYSAVQKSLERRVAIKILPPEMGQDTAFVDRFHQEARLLARLQHPHIVAIYDFGRNASGHLFIVMEYVEGTSLLDIMKKERLPLSRALEVTMQVCEALEFAHNHGVIHRDIKPTNILLDVWGRVRVADYGLAKLAAGSHQTTAQTRSAMVMGTPGYAAPEQRRGETNLDHRADIFSLGVTLYEMLTGHLPVGVFEPPSRKAQTPPALDKIVIRCLRERSQDRYQRARDLRAAILQLAEKMERPLVHRAVAKRPIVSMMTSVIVGGGFIYLLDTLNTEVLQKKVPLSNYMDTEHGPTVVRLNDTFSLIRLKLTWEEARRRIRATEGLSMASFHSEEEITQVMEKLRQKGVDAPLWTGGLVNAPDGPPQWDDGSPFDFQAWMPAAPTPPLIITEIQAKNRKTLRDAQGSTPDWIEVYNPGAEAVDLTGWRLRHQTGRYAFEGRLGGNGVSVAGPLLLKPGEYRLIYCMDSSQTVSGNLAFGFQLEAQTGRIHWADPRGQIVQDLTQNWADFPADESLIYDFTLKSWSWSKAPTPGQQNATAETLFSSPADPVSQAQSILMLPDFDGLWTLDTQRRTAWSLARHSKTNRS